VRGLNDGEAELHEIATVLGTIRADEVHINLPSRPPVEVWVRPADQQALERAVSILGRAAHVVRRADTSFAAATGRHAVEAVLEVLSRHPLRQSELEEILVRTAADDMEAITAELKSCGRAKTVIRNGTTFWTAAEARFPDDEKSWLTAPATTVGKKNDKA